MNMRNRRGAVRSVSALASWVTAVAVGAGGMACGDSGSGGTGGGGGHAGGRGIKVQVSGETLSTDGIAFPGDPTISDGWELKFSHVLVSIDHVTLSANPDKAPSDQTQTDGVVAQVDGPWLVDLAMPGTEIGAGGEGKAVLLTRIENQNKNGGAAFASDERYAFGYQTVVPTASSTKVNLAADAQPFVDRMIANGYAVMYVGTATWKGGSTCKTSDSMYDYTQIPSSIPFEFGFATPTHYINCQNQENMGTPFDGEEYQRGIAIPTNADAVAQLTFHVDHPLFSDVEHDPALFFDHFAGQLAGAAPGTKLTLDALDGLDPTAIDDGAGKPLPWRTCDGSDLPAGTQMRAITGTVPVNPSATPDAALRDLHDFVNYVQSTQGHLNGGEGLCATRRDYPSPP